MTLVMCFFQGKEPGIYNQLQLLSNQEAGTVEPKHQFVPLDYTRSRTWESVPLLTSKLCWLIESVTKFAVCFNTIDTFKGNSISAGKY